MPVTTARSIRVPDAIWHRAIEKARETGTTVTAVVLAALGDFIEAD